MFETICAIILLLLCALPLIFVFSGMNVPLDDKYKNKLHKLTKNLSDIEWSLFREIYNHIEETKSLSEFDIDYNNEMIQSITVKNISFEFCLYDTINNCYSITVDGECLHARKNNYKVFDLLMNYALDKMYKFTEEENKGQESKIEKEQYDKMYKIFRILKTTKN